MRAQNITARDLGPLIPFEQWLAQGEARQIPCSIEISRPRLSILQRLLVNFSVAVPAGALRQLGPTFQLDLAVRLRMGGEWVGPGEQFGTRLQEQLPPGRELEFSTQAFVLPGDYEVGFVLRDRVSGQHSVAVKRLQIRPLAHDPLPEIASDLPRVEFLSESVGAELRPRPELRSRLALPVATRRPLRVEAIVNFTPSEQYAGLQGAYQINAATMLGMLKVLTQLDLTNGSLRVTALDLVRREVIFEQDNVRELDWPRLRDALGQLNAQAIDAKALEGRRQNPAFFRQVLQSRLRAISAPSREAANPASGDGGGRASAAEPQLVFIVLSSPLLFSYHADLDSIPRTEGCNCLFYHLEYRIAPSNLWDQLPRVMRELRPRRFQLHSPLDFRHALAEILTELRAL